MNQLEENNSFLEKLLLNVKPSWKEIWIKILSTENGINLLKFLSDKLKKHNDSDYILPRPVNIFETFKYFEINQTKLVLLGQDPYINIEYINGQYIPQAMGLSFSVPTGVKIPPSLKNIYKELKNCYPDFFYPIINDQNIFLFNMSFID